MARGDTQRKGWHGVLRVYGVTPSVYGVRGLLGGTGCIGGCRVCRRRRARAARAAGAEAPAQRPVPLEKIVGGLDMNETVVSLMSRLFKGCLSKALGEVRGGGAARGEGGDVPLDGMDGISRAAAGTCRPARVVPPPAA